MRLAYSAAIAAAVSGVLFGAGAANASLVTTNGSLSSAGVAAAIIAAPADARQFGATNQAIQAFDEVQNYLLAADLAVDGGVIAAGTRVSSHLIFLNTADGATHPISHGVGANSAAASFSFDGNILGVMSATDGSQFFASDSILGLATTLYPSSVRNNRGMEGDPTDGLTNDDWYSVLANTITLGMHVTTPGDWVRVVTQSVVSQVPVPAALTMLLSALTGLGFIAHRRRRLAAA